VFGKCFALAMGRDLCVIFYLNDKKAVVSQMITPMCGCIEEIAGEIRRENKSIIN